MKTQAAKAARLLKKELKEKYPNVKFSVTSENYAGGSSVNARWTDGPKENDVKPLTYKYQAGHFDGMIDLYEYDNICDDIPQAKYVFCDRTISQKWLEKAEKELIRKYGIENPNDSQEWFGKFGQWKEQVIGKRARELAN